MAKASFNSRVSSAVISYAKGSRKLVELMEEAANNFYPDRQVAEFSFFLNALKDFPVLQKAAFETVRTFGKFEMTLENGSVTIANKGKPSDKALEGFKETIQKYVDAKYNSLLAAHNKQLLKAFDLDQRMKGFANSAAAIVVNALAEEKATKAQVMARLRAALDALETADLDEKIAARKAELEAEKITGEQVATAVANAETVVTENVA